MALVQCQLAAASENEEHRHAVKPFFNWLPSYSYDVQVSGFDSCAESALQRRQADWGEGEAMAALALSMGYPTAACATEHLASTQSYCIPPTSQQVVNAFGNNLNAKSHDADLAAQSCTALNSSCMFLQYLLCRWLLCA